MNTYRIAIVGGGLAGVYAAWRLERAGVHHYILIEARDALGGRIASVCFPPPQLDNATAHASSAASCFDLGPTWYWPAMQPQLDALVRELGLPTIAQYETGDMVLERTPGEAPVRTIGYVSAPPSVRLKGGMDALADALRGGVNPDKIVLGHPVTRLKCDENTVAVETQGVQYRAERVLLAVPPRLALSTIDFSPALPDALARQWSATATWMAPHAKYIAIYAAPFWRERGLSGEARSMSGPLGEIHDASVPGGSAALFGFFGIPTQVRRNVPDDVMRMHCRAQLVRLFGPHAATPRRDVIKDWAQEPWTTTPADLATDAGHGAAPPASATSGIWHNRIFGIASEWSLQFPGYLAGAIEAAECGVRSVLDGQNPTPGRVT